MPRNAILEYKVKLSNHSLAPFNFGRIHIGKEKYFEQYFSFGVSGRVTLYMLKKFKRIQVSGIINWWQDLIIEGFERAHYVDNRLPPKLPQMDGNILVIFLVWLYGLSIAIVLWFWEVKLRFWYCLRYFCKLIKFICMVITAMIKVWFAFRFLSL